MGNDFYKILGAIFMISSGFFYTIERISVRISSSIVAAGYASHGTGNNSTLSAPNYPGFFDNFYIWFLFFVGFVILAYGFPKKS